jgi:uncharacterized protein with PIN domain
VSEPRTRCPMCGYDFDHSDKMDVIKEAKANNTTVWCPSCRHEFDPDHLIGEWDDCAYDY